MVKIYTFFTLFLLSGFVLYSQCAEEQTFVVCDMTTIDGDMNGTPDGIINLYEELSTIIGTTVTTADGMWFDPNFNFALNVSTGDLFLWDLRNSSASESDYQFEFLDSASGCPDDVRYLFNIVLGPFSGTAADTSISGVNLQICQVDTLTECGDTFLFDLFQALGNGPSPHRNGTWEYLGGGNFFAGLDENAGIAQTAIPYSSGPPLVDEETYIFRYTVLGINPCSLTQTTDVSISVVREPFSGISKTIQICEEEILSGAYDSIDLRDDQYLVGEDIEGVWIDNNGTGQISDEGDSVVSLRVLYDDLIASNPRFGCQEYSFTYFVESRSTICASKTSTVTFVIGESIRDFEQAADPPAFCIEDDSLTTLNLRDLIEWQTENGVLYDYLQAGCTDWEYVSGPAPIDTNPLMLSTNNGGFVTALGECVAGLSYTGEGTIDLSDLSTADIGTYVFRFTVSGSYNCDSPLEVFNPDPVCEGVTNFGVQPVCSGQNTLVTIIIEGAPYPGEDTAIDIALCDTLGSIDLLTLLTTNGTDEITSDGEFTDASGMPVANPFIIPDIDNQQTFVFTYSTTSDGGCTDQATLSFTVFEQDNAGEDAIVSFCENEGDNINLYNQLEGTPDDSGTWIGPNNYSASGSAASIDLLQALSGVYEYIIAASDSCEESRATVTITIFEEVNAGEDVETFLCPGDYTLNLSILLDEDATQDGEFIDLATDQVVIDGVIDVGVLDEGIFSYIYMVSNGTCPEDDAMITFTITEVDTPTVSDIADFYCINEGITLGDLIVNGTNDFAWYAFAEAGEELPFSTLLVDEETYFVAAIDDNGCESSRTPYTADILPLSDGRCQINIPDGVSDNGDGINDELTLGSLPDVFPNFDIQVFNRYGTIVYRGDRGTSLFDGRSNTGSGLGDQLPTGVYFYIFYPNEDSSTPIDGTFYLSR